MFVFPKAVHEFHKTKKKKTIRQTTMRKKLVQILIRNKLFMCSEFADEKQKNSGEKFTFMRQKWFDLCQFSLSLYS